MVQPQDIPEVVARTVFRKYLRLPSGDPLVTSLQSIIADSLNAAGLSVTPSASAKEPR